MIYKRLQRISLEVRFNVCFRLKQINQLQKRKGSIGRKCRLRELTASSTGIGPFLPLTDPFFCDRLTSKCGHPAGRSISRLWNKSRLCRRDASGQFVFHSGRVPRPRSKGRWRQRGSISDAAAPSTSDNRGRRFNPTLDFFLIRV